MKYRADIDGLRALAVLAVAIFHINASCMPNGFLGVDVFFVLSGFLITTILYKDISQHTFSFKEFYARRIRRILPVFFVVLFVCLGIAYWLYMPADAVSVGKSALGSVFFAANLLFARHSGYFDVSSEEKPLLHIWSLSIEEQFYFLFPSILIALLWGYDKFISSKEGISRSSFTITALSLLLLLSLGSSFVPVTWEDVRLSEYYLPHIRFGELLSGSVLAVYMSSGARPTRRTAMWLGSLSLVTMIICLFLPNTFVSPWFPGFLALVPCLATVGLLYCNQVDYVGSKIFSSKPVVWVGKISYSLYLWHWPVLAFMRYFWGVGVLPLWLNGVAVVLMFGLSALTYYFVEQPIRKLPWRVGRSALAFYIVPAAIVLGVYFFKKDFPPIAPEYAGFMDETTCCFNTLEGDCLLGAEGVEPKVLVVGDSHTAQLSRFWDYVGKAEGWSAFVSSSIACPFFIDYDYRVPWQIGEACPERNQFVREHYKDFPVIVLANYWGTQDYAGFAEFGDHLRATLSALLESGKKVYLVNSSYQIATPPVREYYAAMRGVKMRLERWDRDPRGEVYRTTQKNAERFKRIVLEEFPEVEWVDLEPYLPYDLKHEGKPLMGDSHHLNGYGTDFIARRFVEDRRLISKELLEPLPAQ